MRDVLLLHGICSTGAVFGPSVGPGLKKLLARDFRVQVGELDVGRRRPGADFDRHLHEDLPRIWENACQTCGTTPGVVGYSMGGMLALAGQALGILSSPRLMLVASPFAFPGVPFYPALMARVLKWAQAANVRRIPIRLAARLLFWYFTLTEGGEVRPSLRMFHALARRAGADIARETLEQAVAWTKTGRMVDRAGAPYLPALARVREPVFFLAGGRDRIAPPDAVQCGFQAVGSPDRHFAVIPEAAHLDFVAGPVLEQTAVFVRGWFSGR